MPQYRIYTIQHSGHTDGPPSGIEAPDDAAAVRLARQNLSCRDLEIWQGSRVVAYLVPDQPSAQARREA